MNSEKYIKKRYNREEKKSGYKEKIKREDIKVNIRQIKIDVKIDIESSIS